MLGGLVLKNISLVVKALLCCGCGACVVICPGQCIQMNFAAKHNIPVVIKQCMECGKCLTVCSGMQLLAEIAETNKVGENITNAEFLACYVSKSADQGLQRSAASGGFITTLALHLLARKRIKGVVCVRSGPNKPTESEFFIAKTSEQIYQASGSRYSPASGCLPLKELLLLKGQYMLVGKPCDLAGIHLLEQNIAVLKERILVKVGILCHHTPFRTALQNLLQGYSLKITDVASLQYRGEGWPGSFCIELKSGENLVLPYRKAWNMYFSRLKYVPIRCLLCDDVFATYADIVVGDPWGEEFKAEKIGYSLTMLKNDKAVDIYNDLRGSDKIYDKKLVQSKIVSYQANLIKKVRAKRLWLIAYIILKHGLNIKVLASSVVTKYSFKEKVSIVKKFLILLRKRRQ